MLDLKFITFSDLNVVSEGLKTLLNNKRVELSKYRNHLDNLLWKQKDMKEISPFIV